MQNAKKKKICIKFLVINSVQLPMLIVTHIMPVLVLLSVVGVGMQQGMIRNLNEMHKLSKVMNGHKDAANNKKFRPLFPNKIFSPTLPWLLVKPLNISLTAVKFPDIPGFPYKWYRPVLKVTGNDTIQ